MKTMPWSTDIMEGSFANVDNFFSTNSANVELLSAGACTCFLVNKMSEFLSGLPESQLEVLVRLSRRWGPFMQREFKKNLKEIAKKRREVRDEEAAKRELRLRTKVTKALALDSEARTLPSRMTQASFDEFRSQSRSDTTTVKEIKLNVSCLKTFYGHKQKNLLTYSAAGTYIHVL